MRLGKGSAQWVSRPIHWTTVCKGHALHLDALLLTDIFTMVDRRLLRGLEYTAKYNLGYDVPYRANCGPPGLPKPRLDIVREALAALSAREPPTRRSTFFRNRFTAFLLPPGALEVVEVVEVVAAAATAAAAVDCSFSSSPSSSFRRMRRRTKRFAALLFRPLLFFTASTTALCRCCSARPPT